VGLEGVDERDAELERAIDDGHAIGQMTRAVAQPQVWTEWAERTYTWLRNGWGLAVAERFEEIAHEHPGILVRSAEQTAYLETLRKRH
jgi:hypothetical protein